MNTERVTIPKKHLWTCLWPGLSELWWRGRLSALPAAIAFAAVINVLLVARFIYVQWLSAPLVWLACWIVAAAWVVLTVRAVRELPQLLSPRAASDQPDRFPDAQAAYLKADYAAAEEALTEVLQVEPRDPPALLLLAGVYRHTGRLHPAAMLLREMRKLEASENWKLEWRAESARLEAAHSASEETDGNPDGTEAAPDAGPETVTDAESGAEAAEGSAENVESPESASQPAKNVNATDAKQVLSINSG